MARKDSCQIPMGGKIILNVISNDVSSLFLFLKATKVECYHSRSCTAKRGHNVFEAWSVGTRSEGTIDLEPNEQYPNPSENYMPT